MSPLRAGTVFLDVRPDTTAFAAQLKAQVTPAATTAGRSISNTLSKVGTGLTSFGKTLTRNVTFPLVGIGVVSTKMALDFDKAFTQISAISTTNREQVAKWRTEVLGLAGETARAPEELAQGLLFLASAGLRTNQIMPTLEASAKAAAAGLGETRDVARLTANVLNAYPNAAIKAADATDILLEAVKQGTAEPDEFASAMGRLLPIASKAEVGFEELAASLATVSNIGLDVNEGVTAMRGLLQAITTPTAQSTEALKDLGLSAGDVRRSLADDGLLDTLDLLEARSKGQIDVLQDLIPNVRSLTGFFGLQGQEAAKVDAIFRRVADSTGALDKAFRKTAESDSFKFQKAMNQLRVAAIQLGNQIIPIITDTVVPAIEDAVKWFSELSPEAQKLGVQLGGLAVVAGPLVRVGGALTSMAGGAIRLAGGLAGISGSSGGVGALVRLGAAAGPLTLAAIAIHDITAAVTGLRDDGALGYVEESLNGWASELLRGIPGIDAWVEGAGGIATALRDGGSDVEAFRQGMGKIGIAVKKGELKVQDATKAIEDLTHATGVELPNGAAAAARAFALSGQSTDEADAKIRVYTKDIKAIPRNWQTRVVAETAQAQATLDRFITNNTGRVIGVRVATTGFAAVGGGHQLAGGTRDFAGGMALVGEKGPELAIFPRHTQVIPNHRLRGGDGADILSQLNAGRDDHITEAVRVGVRQALQEERRAGVGRKAAVEVHGFHRASIRFDADRDWQYAQWGW